MSLLPGLEAELLRASERTAPDAAPASARGRRPGEVAPSARRRRRRPGHIGLYAVIGALVFSGAAYAARGLWQPVLGNDEGGRPKATLASPPQRQLDLLSVLRRPQNDDDRGVASSAILRTFRPRDGDIRTQYVRRLATAPNGAIVVLVPVEQIRPGDTAYGRRDDAQLCLAIFPTRGAMEPPRCGPTTQLLVGGGFEIEVRDPLTPAQEKARERAIRRAQVQGRLEIPKAGQPGVAVDDDVSAEIDVATNAAGPPRRSYAVGLVPDVVHSVRFFDLPGKPVQRVRGNVYMRELASPSTAWSPSWLDADGRTLNADGVRVQPSPLVP